MLRAAHNLLAWRIALDDNMEGASFPLRIQVYKWSDVKSELLLEKVFKQFYWWFVQAFRKYNEGRMKEIVDPSMKGTVDEEILEKMFDLAIQCVAPTRADRPDMKLVGEHLWGIRMDYHRSGRRE